MPTINLSVNQRSDPQFVPAGSIVTVIPNAGANAVVEYSMNAQADIINGVATWAAWRKGTASAATADLIGNDMWMRATANVGAVTLSINTTPTKADLAAYRGNFGTFDPAAVAITGGTVGPAARIAGMGAAEAAPYYPLAEARLVDSANIDGQAYSSSAYNNYCVFPTVIKDYQGNPGTAGSGAIVEPSLLHFPQGWNGWEFWLAAMPYDGSNAQYENPCIFCSHDGKNWTTPAGVNNPLVLPPDGTNHNYDNTLFMLDDGVTMAILYGQTSFPNAGLFYITSADGVNWTAPVAMSGTNFATATHYLYTSCPFYDRVAKQWTMYSVDAPGGSGGSLVYQTASALAGPWSAPVAIANNFPAGETAVFHIDLKVLPGNEVIGLAMTGGAGGGRCYPMRIPPNGTGFGNTVQYGPVLRPGNFLTSNAYLYRCSAVPVGRTWKALFGIIGPGPQTFNFMPGTIEFDASAYFSALYGRNAGLMPNAQLTGTAQAVALFSGGLFWDSFNHASFGTCTASGGGSASTWTTAGTGTLAIVSNQLKQTVSGNSHAYVDTASADVDLQVSIATLGGGFHVTWRVQDTNNFWRLNIFSGQIHVQSVASGTATGIAASTITTSEANSMVRVLVRGNSIKVFWQGLLVLEANSSYLNTQTKHGVQFGTDTTTALANVLMTLPR